MASIEEIVNSLQAALDELNDAISATNTAESETGEMINMMSGAGVDDKVQELSGVKDAIQKARSHLSGGVDLLNEAVNAAKAAGGG